MHFSVRRHTHSLHHKPKLVLPAHRLGQWHHPWAWHLSGDLAYTLAVAPPPKVCWVVPALRLPRFLRQLFVRLAEHLLDVAVDFLKWPGVTVHHYVFPVLKEDADEWGRREVLESVNLCGGERNLIPLTVNAEGPIM